MTTLRDAAETLERHCKTLDAFQTAAAALRGLDSLANAEKEAVARRAGIEKQAADAQARFDALKTMDADIKAEREQRRAQAEQHAHSMEEDADARAIAVVQAATEQAAQVVSDALSKSEQLLASAKEAVQPAVQARQAAEAAAAIAVGNTEAARKELDALNSKIAEAKAAIEKMLKG